jgi:hypothetical protein
MRATPAIISVTPAGGYRLRVRFADGCEGDVDLSDIAGSGVFAVLRDPAQFRKVTIDPETGTLTWPGGLDIAPERLYEEASRTSAAPVARDKPATD